ncbi:MAG TPA: hypothetical protein VL422_10935 [Miltoncostaea sp.]|nr:hypothetical protein [Miltoncostaea sp.]
MITQRTWAKVVAGGCAAWVALAFGRTERMAEVVGTTPSEVRALGVRDAASGVALLLAADPRLPLATRVALDLSDAARYGRGRPRVLAMTLGFAAVGAAGLFLRR